MFFPHLAQIHVLFKSDYGYVQMLAGSADSRNMGELQREREREREPQTGNIEGQTVERGNR